MTMTPELQQAFAEYNNSLLQLSTAIKSINMDLQDAKERLEIVVEGMEDLVKNSILK